MHGMRGEDLRRPKNTTVRVLEGENHGFGGSASWELLWGKGKLLYKMLAEGEAVIVI